MLPLGLTSLAQVAPQSEDPLAWAAPAAATAAAGQTSATITWAAATGGAGGYTYSAASVVYDSQGASTTASVSTSGSGAGTTTVSGLVNGQTVVVSRTATDSDGVAVQAQGVAAIAAAAATLTLSSAPAGQTLAAGTASATLGTWGAATGGTPAYSYAVTELSGGGTTISGSGLGPHNVTGLTDGQTYAYLMTATDSLGAKGYSVVTVSVAAGTGLGAWEELARCDFTDADWTALSSTDATVNASAWQHVLYAADGVTPRAYVLNGSSQARTLGLAPSGSGLSLTNGTSTATPSVFVWPANWTALLGASRRDAWLIEAIIEGEEPAGSGTFAHVQGVSNGSGNANASPTTGYIARNTGSNTIFRAASYITAFDEQTIQTVTAGATRLYRASVQVTITDFRRHDVHSTLGVTDYQDPQTGQRVRVQSASTSMSAVGAEAPTSASWGGTSIGGRTKWGMWHDGTATSGSRVRLRKLRLLRMPLGSL